MPVEGVPVDQDDRLTGPVVFVVDLDVGVVLLTHDDLRHGLSFRRGCTSPWPPAPQGSRPGPMPKLCGGLWTCKQFLAPPVDLPGWARHQVSCGPAAAMSSTERAECESPSPILTGAEPAGPHSARLRRRGPRRRAP